MEENQETSDDSSHYHGSIMFRSGVTFGVSLKLGLAKG